MNEWEWQLLEDKRPLEHLEIDGAQLKTGDRVRLRPRPGGDVMDIALAGQSATIEALEQDYEGKAHVCVVLDEDPGRDMGFLRQPGHRFFFDADEVAPLDEADAKPAPVKPSILVAGIGNIFLGDDAFGVEVARRLLQSEMPAKVRVTDFGIRSLDLTYALQDGYETVILVDAVQRGAAPGTVYVIEPQLDTGAPDQIQNAVIDSHGMDPVQVLKLAAAMGTRPQHILLVGCEPENLGGDEGLMGLSAPVEAAVNQAVKRIESLVIQLLQEQRPGSQQ
jgi:hydrogenase maturation protease